MPSNRLSSNALKLIAAAVGGIVAGYYLDPIAGNSRRLRLRDRILKAGRQLLDQERLALKDLEHRAQGRMCELRTRLKSNIKNEDGLVRDRIKSIIGHICSHPRAIQVEVKQQAATLSGDILSHELKPLLLAVKMIRGVECVDNKLTEHESGDDVPALKGSGRRVIYNALRREYWPPAHRIGFGLGGLMLVVNGMRGRGISSFLGVTVGSILLTRATLNRSLRRIFGMGVGPDVISVQKTVNFKAPVATVYELWRCPEKFPSFMRNVRHVEKHNNGKHHWVVKGPAGVDILFSTEITEQRENKRLSWRSMPGSMVSHRGSAYFEDHGDSTTVHLHMRYNPILGYLGHLVAFGLHADPKTLLDGDMVRMKAIIESGGKPVEIGRKTA